jgi:hypothetical protein
MRGLICIPILIYALAVTSWLGAEESIIIFGEYPVVEELGRGSFEDKKGEELVPFIHYEKGEGYKEKAFIEALHILNANVFGYTFAYKPGSILMKTEEIFDVKVRGSIDSSMVYIEAEGVSENIYRIKLGFKITPSVHKWQSAFHSGTIRPLDSEGTSDFYRGWEARSEALYDALRNLVLSTARRQLSSKPLLLKGDILLNGNPEFSVGAGRHYCKIHGFVNFVEIITYD